MTKWKGVRVMPTVKQRLERQAGKVPEFHGKTFGGMAKQILKVWRIHCDTTADHAGVVRADCGICESYMVFQSSLELQYALRFGLEMPDEFKVGPEPEKGVVYE